MLTLRREKRGFTLIELLVVIAIIAILAAILFPVFAKAREMARKSTCQSNLKQLTLSFNMYQNDYDATYPSAMARTGSATWSAAEDEIFRKQHGLLPPTVPANTNGAWPEFVHPYLKNVNIIYCPSDPNAKPAAQAAVGDPVSYVIKLAFHKAWYGDGTVSSAKCKKEGDFEYPADQLLLYERQGWHFGDANKGDQSVTPQSQVSLNCGFVDGHVATKRLPTPLNGEPDLYNTVAETGAAIAGGVDPRYYLDTLQ